MKQKLLKMLLIPSLGLMTTTAAITTATSCGSSSDWNHYSEKDFETKCFWITPYGDNDITFNLWKDALAENSPNLEFALVGKNKLKTIDNLQDAKWKSVVMDDQYTVKANQIMALRGNNPNGWLRFYGDAATPTYTQTANISIFGDTTIGGSLMGLLDNGGKTKISDIPDRCFSSLFRSDKTDSTASEICEIKNNLFWSINTSKNSLGAHCFQNMFGYNDKLTEVCLDDVFPTNAKANKSTYAYEFQHSSVKKFSMSVYDEPSEDLYAYMLQLCSALEDVTLDFTDGFDTSVALDSFSMYYKAYRSAFSNWNHNTNASGTIKFITHLTNSANVVVPALINTFNLGAWTIDVA